MNASKVAHMKTKKHEKFIANKEKGSDVKPDPKEQKRIYNQTHREKKKVENRVKDMDDIKEFDEVIDKFIDDNDDMKYNATRQVLIEAMSKKILKIVKVKSGHINIAEIKVLIKKHKIICDKIKAAIDDPESDSEDEGENEPVAVSEIIAPKYEDKPIDLNHIFFPERYPKPEEIIPQEKDIIPQ